MIFSFNLTVAAESQEENAKSIEINNVPAVCENELPNAEISETIGSAEFKSYTFALPAKNFENYLSIPEEMLSASTAELLKYFLNSTYLIGQLGILSSAQYENNENDFSKHKAFEELLNRDDLVPAIKEYASNLSTRENNLIELKPFQKFLDQIEIKEIIENKLGTGISFYFDDSSATNILSYTI